MEGQNGKSRQGIRQEASWRAPMVSIIVPVYNVEAYLADCVESIYAQTFEDYELLLIDDASTDGSGRLADELASRDPRARVVHHDVNQGAGSAGPSRNRGIRESIGKYIAFIDSDDWVKPDYLSSLVTTAEKYQADLVRMGHEYVFPQADGSWKSERIFQPTKTAGFLTKDKKERMRLMTRYSFSSTVWSTLILRDLFTRKELRFEKVLSEDILFSFLLLYAADAYFLLPDTAYCYRQAPTSMVHVKSVAKSRKAMQSAMKTSACVERELGRMKELQDDLELVQSIREWFADAYLRWLWLPGSDGMDLNAVLKETKSVFHEIAPEQAGLLSLLFSTWLQQFSSGQRLRR